eukprot:5816062-Amphidinium_carterae.1
MALQTPLLSQSHIRSNETSPFESLAPEFAVPRPSLASASGQSFLDDLLALGQVEVNELALDARKGQWNLVFQNDSLPFSTLRLAD